MCRGKNQDGPGFHILNQPGTFKPVQSGHFHIQETDIGPQLLKLADQFRTIVRLPAQFKSFLALHDLPQDQAHAGFIIRNQDTYLFTHLLPFHNGIAGAPGGVQRDASGSRP